MNQTIEWIQTNWYQLGSLIAQFTFLFAGLWFARKILKAMLASQQQFGALLRLSMSEGLEDPPKVSEAIHSSTPSLVASAVASPVIDPPTAPTRRSTAYAAFERPFESEAPSPRHEPDAPAQTNTPITPAMPPTAEANYEPTPYVAAPLTLPADEESGSCITAAEPGAVQWLQTPMASKRKSNSAWRRVVRWLQAPVRG